MVVDWWSRRADAQIVDQILAQDLDFETTAVIDRREWPELPGATPEHTVRDLTDRSQPDTARFHVRSDQPGLLVIANSHAPGWSATVNGVQTDVVRTNWIVQGLFLPAGESDVVLTYRAPGSQMGLIVSGLSIALLGALVFRSRRATPRKLRRTPLRSART
jgi:hypothetical protein